MSAGCRIGRVRYKAGGAQLVLLQAPEERSRQRCLQMVRETVDAAEDVGGWAFVVWGPDGASVAAVGVPRSNIPSILVPDFVRNRLLAYRREDWTLETVNDQWGAP